MQARHGMRFGGAALWLLPRPGASLDASRAAAVRSIVRRVQAGELGEDDIAEQTVSQSLYTAELPDPDLLIRTASEYRISNFLLWQISYAELYVTDVLWPDFDTHALFAAIRAYARRERRDGGRGD